MRQLIVYRALNEEDILHVIENKEFAAKLLNGTQQTVIILTQSWCGQWVQMQRWLTHLNEVSDQHSSLSVYYFEYDRSNIFDTFRLFKESYWNNHEVPYLRYYLQGNLITESNYVTQEQFFSAFSV